MWFKTLSPDCMVFVLYFSAGMPLICYLKTAWGGWVGLDRVKDWDRLIIYP